MAKENPSVYCPNCGGPIELPAASDFLLCAHCGSTLFADTADTVLCLYAPLRARAGDIVPYVRRFLSRYELHGTVELRNFEGLYLPFWHLARGRRSLERAAFSLSYEALLGYKAPQAARFERVPAEQKAAGAMRWLPPVLPLEAMLAEWERLFSEPAENLSIRLRYVPIYTVEYEYEGSVYRATMDGITGEVLPEEIPPSPALLLDRRAIGLCVGSGALFLAEGIFLPSFWLTLAGYIATGALLYPLVARILLGAPSRHHAL